MSNDDSLDRAIDQVARELTAASPRHSFAARVRARLEPGPHRFTRAWQLAGATAVLALVAFLMWPVADRYEEIATSRQTAGAPKERTGTVPQRAIVPEPPAVRSSVTAPRAARAATTPAPPSHGRSEAPARMRIPIDREAPQLAAIQGPADLTLEPIEIRELTIAPLEPEKESR